MFLSERSRNYIVGLTMLIAMAALMAGIFALGRFPGIAQVKAYPLTIIASDAGGLAPGNKVNFNNVAIGSVSYIALAADMRTVSIVLSIDQDINIPSNAIASVGKATIGNPYINLYLPDDPAHPGQRIASAAFLPKDGTASMAAQTQDGGLIPKQVIDAFTSASQTINDAGKSLQLLLEQRSLADYEKQDPDKRIANISILVQRLDRDAKAIDVIIGDPKNQEHFSHILANIDESSANLQKILADFKVTAATANVTIEKFGDAATEVKSAATQTSTTVRISQAEIIKVADKLTDLLNSLEKSTNAIAEGKGTAGRLVNDPRLYDGLVDLTQSLKTTTDDLHTLIQKWKEEGLKLNLK